MNLATLIEALRAAPGIALKRDIEPVAEVLSAVSSSSWLATPDAAPIRNGDDAAAIPDGDGFLLLAAEGMLPGFVAADPWFAGFCAVMVNVSDIAAMGGTPYAVVDVLFSGDTQQSRQVLTGMRDAARMFGVPVVGGHTSRSPGSTLLAAAIVGRARKLITSFDARPGDQLLLAIDLRGSYRGASSYFDAATAGTVNPRQALAVLPELAEAGLTCAGKDVSMAGIAGTLVMLCEGSGVGARLELDALPRPSEVPLLRWLCTFPSFGFLLAVRPAHSERVQARFAAVGVACAAVGGFQTERKVELTSHGERALFWDLAREPLTGFGPVSARVQP